MFVLECTFILAAVFQIISAQDFPPPRCKLPPPKGKTPHECCKVPYFFTEDEFAECGFQHPESEKGRFGPPPPPMDCSKQLCLLRKHNLVTDTDEIDADATGKFIDDWAKSAPELKPTAEEAKKTCLVKNLPGPPHACEADKMMFCVFHTVMTTCPKWEEDDECQKVKEFMESCKPT